MRFCQLVLLLLLCLGLSGCGRFAARRIAQAPNTYPKWLAPKAPVTIEFSDNLLRAFTNRQVNVQHPPARLRYRVVEPANFGFHWTNQVDEATGHATFVFNANVDRLAERTNQWTGQPRGTAVLVHGYGVSGFAMLPWALHLAQEGWRCVLIDLRGHGKSTGERVHFGPEEALDLSLILDALDRDGNLVHPIAAVGVSFGAVVALRAQLHDPRIEKVVAISPYADLGRAILNIRKQYAKWLPEAFIRAGVRKLPALLNANACDLNPECWIAPAEEYSRPVFFVAGEDDRIAPVDEVRRLHRLVHPPARFLVVPNAGHEALPFYLDELAGEVTAWLDRSAPAETSKLLAN